MKNRLQLIIVLLLSLNAVNSFAQRGEHQVIRISRVSYVFNHSGSIKRQVEIDLSCNKVYRRKKANRKFKEFKSSTDISLFKDSLKIERLRDISKSLARSSEECLYHNEYGYYRIELLTFNEEDLVYGETFLINRPYECLDQRDLIVVSEFFQLITSLFNEN
jgi:hypothetical protein